jgi:hypothetical protein
MQAEHLQVQGLQLGKLHQGLKDAQLALAVCGSKSEL